MRIFLKNFLKNKALKIITVSFLTVGILSGITALFAVNSHAVENQENGFYINLVNSIDSYFNDHRNHGQLVNEVMTNLASATSGTVNTTYEYYSNFFSDPFHTPSYLGDFFNDLWDNYFGTSGGSPPVDMQGYGAYAQTVGTTSTSNARQMFYGNYIYIRLSGQIEIWGSNDKRIKRLVYYRDTGAFVAEFNNETVAYPYSPAQSAFTNLEMMCGDIRYEQGYTGEIYDFGNGNSNSGGLRGPVPSNASAADLESFLNDFINAIQNGGNGTGTGNNYYNNNTYNYDNSTVNNDNSITNIFNEILEIDLSGIEGLLEGIQSAIESLANKIDELIDSLKEPKTDGKTIAGTLYNVAPYDNSIVENFLEWLNPFHNKESRLKVVYDGDIYYLEEDGTLEYPENSGVYYYVDMNYFAASDGSGNGGFFGFLKVLVKGITDIIESAINGVVELISGENGLISLINGKDGLISLLKSWFSGDNGIISLLKTLVDSVVSLVDRVLDFIERILDSYDKILAFIDRMVNATDEEKAEKEREFKQKVKTKFEFAYNISDYIEEQVKPEFERVLSDSDSDSDD